MSNAKLFFWKDIFMYTGSYFKIQTHFHSSIQLVFSTSGMMFKEPDHAWIETKAAFINSDVPYRVRSIESETYFICLDESSDLGSIVSSTILRGKEILLLDEAELQRLTELFQSHPIHDTQAFYDAFVGWIHTFCHAEHHPVSIDPRLKKAVIAMQEASPDDLFEQDVADVAGIQKGIFMRIFSTAMGLPFKRYVLWLTIARILVKIISGKKFQKAIEKMGIYGPSEFVRIFSKLVGVNPKKYLRVIDQFEIHLCMDYLGNESEKREG